MKEKQQAKQLNKQRSCPPPRNGRTRPTYEQNKHAGDSINTSEFSYKLCVFMIVCVHSSCYTQNFK